MQLAEKQELVRLKARIAESVGTGGVTNVRYSEH